MKVLLLGPGGAGLDAPLPPHADELERDLDLSPLIDSMARGDKRLREAARRGLLASLADPDEIRYRQEVLKDCIAHEGLVRELKALAAEALDIKRRNWFWSYGSDPSSTLYSAARVIRTFLPLLDKLRAVARGGAGSFGSRGFKRFFAMIRDELDDEFYAAMIAHLDYLADCKEALIGVGLGRGCALVGHRLVKSPGGAKGWLERLRGLRRPVASFSIDPRDKDEAEALDEHRNRGLNAAADGLARAGDHIEGFVDALAAELSFYEACLNLRADLAALGEAVCFPEALPAGARGARCHDLRNASLALRSKARTVGNELDAGGMNPIIVTGANEGGKTTFLRSLGAAQLLMQAGMFVPAEHCEFAVATGIFTHFKRMEDRAMASGKLDEELARMERIAEAIRPGALALFNESFAATNEREGSEIASQIVRALVDEGVRVVFVTHLYPFAKAFADAAEALKANEGAPRALLLKAERLSDGNRTFKILPGLPSMESHGKDLFEKIFGSEEAQAR